MTDTTSTTPRTEMTQMTEAADMLSTLRAIPGLRRAWPAGGDSEPASASIECVDGRGRLAVRARGEPGGKTPIRRRR